MRAWFANVQERLHLSTFVPVLVVSSLLSMLSFAGSIIIQTVLSVEDVGTYTLITALVAMIGPLAGLGQGGQMIRLYGREGPGAFNWPRDLARTMLWACVAVVLFTLAVRWIYRAMDPLAVAVVGVVSVNLTLIGLLVSILRPHREYLSSAFLLKAPFALSILVGGAACLLPQGSLRFVLLGTVLSFLAVALAGSYLVRARVPVGVRTFSRNEKSEGVTYVLWTIGDILGGYGEIAVAGAMLPAASLALYGVGRNIVRTFDMTRSSIDVFLATEIQQRRGSSLRRPFVVMLGLAALLVVLHLVAAPYLLHVLFRGRYDGATALVVVLAIAGGLRLVQGLSHNALIVADESIVLRTYLAVGLGVEVLSLPIIAGMTRSLGILGTAAGVCIAWGLRAAAGYGILLWSRRRG